MARITSITETSESQQKALAIVPKVVSILSCISSLYIIVDIWRMPSIQRKLYHRILLGISISDCISSTAWFFSTWPIPPDVIDVWGAIGTQQTCSIQGFFSQASIAAVLYSGSLAAYYYLVLRCGWTAHRLQASHLEWIVHSVCITFTLATATTATSMGLMNPENGWICWIASVPLNCNESWLHSASASNCTRGDNASLYEWLFFFVPLWTVIVSVTIAMALIVLQFEKQERLNERWRQKSVFGGAGGVSTTSAVTASHQSQQQQQHSTSSSNGGVGSSHKSSHKSSSNTTASYQQQKQQHNSLMEMRQQQRQRTNDVLLQSVLYVGAFYVTWTFPTILHVTQLSHHHRYHFHWVMLTATFVPLQGMWNLIIYLRPQYLQARRLRQKRKRQEQRRKERQQEHQRRLEVAKIQPDGGTSRTIAAAATDAMVSSSSSPAETTNPIDGDAIQDPDASTPRITTETMPQSDVRAGQAVAEGGGRGLSDTPPFRISRVHFVDEIGADSPAPKQEERGTVETAPPAHIEISPQLLSDEDGSSFNDKEAPSSETIIITGEEPAVFTIG